MYVNSQKNAVSGPFGATNRVMQGSVLSSILFTLCLDDLIAELEDNSDGCRIGMNNFGIIRFADNLKLLPPSLLDLQRMLNICKAFSTSTTVLLLVQRRLSVLSFIMGIM